MEATLLPPAGKAADPYACIGTKNAKHVQNCLELYMNDRGIDYLPEGVFERFIDLKYLWLMRNNLAKLENLDENFRLHCLYLSKNRLTTFVDSSLAKLKNLEELHASDNQLTDLHEHIEVLKKLRRLKRLDLKGNPLAHETKYRLHVIKHMPWLEELDLVTVTDAERAKARRVTRPTFDATQPPPPQLTEEERRAAAERERKRAEKAERRAARAARSRRSSAACSRSGSCCDRTGPRMIEGSAGLSVGPSSSKSSASTRCGPSGTGTSRPSWRPTRPATTTWNTCGSARTSSRAATGAATPTSGSCSRRRRTRGRAPRSRCACAWR